LIAFTQNRYPLLLVARMHDPEKWEPVFGATPVRAEGEFRAGTFPENY
jgi:3-hydroxymyristoyl/3-hydroxydecanoyl-(acyl carrier protein) dehydratase